MEKHTLGFTRCDGPWAHLRYQALTQDQLYQPIPWPLVT